MVERCTFCNKKIGLMVFTCSSCKCKYCLYHRIPEDHKCSCQEKEKVVLIKLEDNKNLIRI